LIALGVPNRAGAQDFSFKLEPGVAFPLTKPQSTIYDVGVSETIKALFGLTPFLDIGPSASVVLLPAAVDGDEAGIAWTLGGGLRLKRPHDAESVAGISPWLDADVYYVRTGDLDRPGFAAAVGLSVPIGKTRTFWLGPFVRYFQTAQAEREAFDNRDAKVLTIGLSFEVGSGLEREPEHPFADAVYVAPPAPAQVAVCPDLDADDIPDKIDRCPEVPGVLENSGCPPYDKVVVKRDKLELKEKIYFAWDQATIEPVSYPLLDDVVRALQDSKGSRVQVEGHADSSGTVDHNQTLSEQRAGAVLDYLVAHGIAKDRLSSKGLSSSVPNDTNQTAAGRENNRRVEFVVNFVILNSGSAP
jgi:outer membrane protein OmpA-like peptidoglycan-associated protein